MFLVSCIILQYLIVKKLFDSGLNNGHNGSVTKIIRIMELNNHSTYHYKHSDYLSKKLFIISKLSASTNP